MVQGARCSHRPPPLSEAHDIPVRGFGRVCEPIRQTRATMDVHTSCNRRVASCEVCSHASGEGERPGELPKEPDSRGVPRKQWRANHMPLWMWVQCR
jgi:hypothetical protein